MVGDVKQSIYKFRRACPELFIDKYEKYDLDGNDEGLKIKLFKNFRSRKNILDVTNTIFESIMSKELGDIDYNEDEYLNLGADFEEIENGVGKSEVCVIDNIDKDKISDDETIEDDALEEISQITKEEIEGKYVAKRIREMIDKKLLVKDKKHGIRQIKYKDIVILLRSTKNANIIEKELLKNNIPVFSDVGSEYLDAMEIQTIISLLKILDNPLDDIALVAVLRSVLFGFTDNEIIEIRIVNKEKSFWNSVLEAFEKLEDENLKNKIGDFLEKIKNWKFKSEYLPLTELIWEIYVDTGFYNYVSLMPNGALRQANLKMLFERAKDYERTSFKGLFNFIRFIEKLKIGNSDLGSAKVIGENEDVVRIMTIHKSKGLEFPAVFLCNSNKKINFQDLTGDILLHSDMGIGPEYINYERKIEYSTAAKHAIKLKLKEENISEEMRILYVALTRAKEKLIITAVRNSSSDKEIKSKNEILDTYSDGKKINEILLKKYTSYLDWIELVKLNLEKMGEKFDSLDFTYLNSDEISKEDSEEEDIIKIDFSEYNNFEEIKKKLEWKYKYLSSCKIPIKTTVSTIKKMENEENDFDSLNHENIGLSKLVPEFMGDEKVVATKKGTLMHLVLQKIDFNSISSKQDVSDFIEYLKSKNFFSDVEANSIDVDCIFNFINSDFAFNIKQAKAVYKEKPFCIKIKANKFFENTGDEDILVQGIIDLYYINKDGEIILVDYKTDFIENGKEIEFINKYKTQLEIYKDALENSLGKSVKHTYIYSLYLNKEFEIF